MARPITINIPHSLGKEEARRRIDQGFATIEQQMTGGLMKMVSFQHRWEADRLYFQGGTLGQVISGRLDVLADSVQMQIDLPDLLCWHRGAHHGGAQAANAEASRQEMTTVLAATSTCR